MAKISIVNELRALEIGKDAIFPAEMCTSIHSCASHYGFQWNRVFRTKIDRENRVIRVTRES